MLKIVMAKTHQNMKRWTYLLKIKKKYMKRNNLKNFKINLMQYRKSNKKKASRNTK